MNFLNLKRLYESYLSIYNDDLTEIYNFFKLSGNHLTKKQFEKLADKFIDYCVKYLKIKNKPKVHFVEDPKFAERIGAFGAITANDKITIDILDRHPMDILRTTAHELVHFKQHEMNVRKPGSGHVGSPTENEANKKAGIILRNFGSDHPELFELSSVKK
jgi:hypothetical protein